MEIQPALAQYRIPKYLNVYKIITAQFATKFVYMFAGYSPNVKLEENGLLGLFKFLQSTSCGGLQPSATTVGPFKTSQKSFREHFFHTLACCSHYNKIAWLAVHTLERYLGLLCTL